MSMPPFVPSVTKDLSWLLELGIEPTDPWILKQRAEIEAQLDARMAEAGEPSTRGVAYQESVKRKLRDMIKQKTALDKQL
ncbi:MAG: hypothetical protein LQ340_002321, partial [Diploschistes diacapsis]